MALLLFSIALTLNIAMRYTVAFFVKMLAEILCICCILFETGLLFEELLLVQAVVLKSVLKSVLAFLAGFEIWFFHGDLVYYTLIGIPYEVERITSLDINGHILIS